MFEMMQESRVIAPVAEQSESYLDELEKANKKIEQLYHFIEMTEALTYDRATSVRIRSFLQEKGVWEKPTPSKNQNNERFDTARF